jgi:hypothetical protein
MRIQVGVVNVSVAGCKIELFNKTNDESYARTAPEWTDEKNYRRCDLIEARALRHAVLGRKLAFGHPERPRQPLRRDEVHGERDVPATIPGRVRRRHGSRSGQRR